MLWTLLKAQFAGFFSSFAGKGKKKVTAGKIALAVVVLVYLLLMLVFLTGATCVGMAVVLNEENLWLYFGFSGFMSLALCLVTGIFSVQSRIFSAKDNELLLSMPIPPRYILGSRMAFVLIPDIIFTALINATALVVYIFFHRISILGIFALILSTLFIPMISFAVSALIGWIISVITVRLPKKNIFGTLLFVLFFAGYMYVCFNMNNIISNFMINSNAYADTLSGIFPIYHLGRSISDGSLVSLGILALCGILPFVLVVFILDRSFIGLVTSNRGYAKVKYVVGKEKRKSPLWSLVTKEFSKLFSSTVYLLNAGMGVIIYIIAIVAVIWKAPMLGEINTVMGGILPMYAIAGMCFISSTVLITAPSISLEGNKLWILSSMPISGREILLAKLIMHEMFTAPVMLILSLVLSVVFEADIGETVVMILLPQAYNLVQGIGGLLINIKFPKLDFVNEAQVVKQSASIVVTMFGSMGLTLVLFIPAIILSMFISPVLYFAVCTVLLSGAAFALYKLLMGVGVRAFERIS